MSLKDLQSVQLDVRVLGRAEAAIHVTRRFVDAMLFDNVTVKLDFTNAFNTVRHDLILNNVVANTPEIYRFAFAKYTCELQLLS